METLFSDCSEVFVLSRAELEVLEKEYSLRAKEEEISEDSDTYFRDILKRIKSILSQIKLYSKKLKHIEL